MVLLPGIFTVRGISVKANFLTFIETLFVKITVCQTFFVLIDGILCAKARSFLPLLHIFLFLKTMLSVQCYIVEIFKITLKNESIFAMVMT